MTTTGLPAGYRVRYVDPDFGLFVTDPSLFDPPNPPSTLLPIEQYSDSIYTGGTIHAVIEDANGHFVGSADLGFQLTSVSSVPEPSSALLAGVAFSLIAAWARWRRPGRSV